MTVSESSERGARSEGNVGKMRSGGRCDFALWKWILEDLRYSCFSFIHIL